MTTSSVQSDRKMSVMLCVLVQSIGCDYVQHSTARYDRCGVCKGTGGTCQKVEYLYRTKDSDPVNVTVLRLPKGSRNIYIKEHLVQETSHLCKTQCVI